MSEQNLPVIGEVVHIPQAGEGVTCRTVPDFLGYAAGDDGSVWSCLSRKGCNIHDHESWKPNGEWRRIRPNTVSKYGHQQVGLSRNGKVVKLMVHGIVLMAFVGPCQPQMECRHFPDRDPANNSVTNLSWSTRSTNSDDRYGHETIMSGEKNHRAKTTAENVVEIRRAYDDGKGERKTAPVGLLMSLCNKYKLSRGAVDKIVGRQTWVKRLPKRS